MSDHSLFLKKFLAHGTKIASLAPSSPWLSRATIRNVDWSKLDTIVELGAGTGPITKEIVDRLRPETRFLTLERDPDFARLLRERFSGRANVEVIEGDVRDLATMLSERGIDRVEAVISGLPIPSFPKELTRELFQVIHRVLHPEGTFNQITELALVYKGLYKRYFEDVRFIFEPRNLPPAGAYHCRRPIPIAD
ncbi:MAG: methyltransferase domain-containing protein [Isosphaeraceae bacterium]|nr:methyltransferase domain-containing protein [Isosphaeraceae bacterium]